MNKRMNTKVRLGIVGLGNIAKQHIANVESGAVPNCEITAICTRSGPTVQSTSIPQTNTVLKRLHFSDYKALIDSDAVDAVLIATPTMTHVDIAEYALEKRLHVMIEKPVALSSFEGESLLKIAKSRSPASQCAVMLNQRTDPVYKKMKSIVDSGELGEIVRTHWTMTNWFRPEIYFQVSDWRATWRGEGGGLLVNQCIHNLDIFQWICGMPSSIHAFCEFGKYHDIEVEDEVSAVLHYENGASGTFIASTGEAPGQNRFDIIGDKGSLHFDDGRLYQKVGKGSTQDFNKTTSDMFGTPEYSERQLSPIEDIGSGLSKANNAKVNQHALILSNFVNAILGNETLLVGAEEGLNSLDLANAMLLSTWEKSAVRFPLVREKYQQHLNKKVEGSTLRVKSSKKVNIDMASSYR